MLFQKKIDPRCAYCERGARLDENSVACLKRGVVSAGGSCHKFKYDPLKRIPSRPAPPDFSRLKDEDFTL